MLSHLFTDPVVGFFTVAASILFISLLLGQISEKIRMPRVVMEMLSGIILSKVFLGEMIGVDHWKAIFQPDILLLIKGFGLFGVGAYMFQMGEHLHWKEFKAGNGIPTIGIATVILPFILGICLGDYLHADWGPKVPRLVFDLFVGLSIAATAFPVLCRILDQLGLLRTDIGRTTVAIASVNDVLVYMILAIVTAMAATVGVKNPIWPFFYAAGYIVGMVVVVRPILNRLLHRWDLHNGDQLAMLCTILLFSFAAAELARVHVIFGGFIMGAIVPKDVLSDITERVMEKFVRVFLMPLFFAYSGLRIGGVEFTSDFLWITGLLVSCACVAKIVPGYYLARRMLSYSRPRSIGFSVLMNTRGTVELVLLNIGLDAGILSPALFGMLVAMTIITTAATGPIVSLLIRFYRDDMKMNKHED